MKPTEQLSKEHEAIKLMLQILGKVCGKLEANQKVDAKHLEQIVEFIKVFADRCHGGKEEDLLFPALEEAGIPREGGPIAVMLEEHTIGRNCIKGMADALAKQKSDSNWTQNFVKNARDYIMLLDQHIDKENNILYQIADLHLSEEKQAELLEQFEKVEQEKIGKGKHEEFHKLLENLESIYLE